MSIVEIVTENRVATGIVIACIASMTYAVVRRGNRLNPSAAWVSNGMVYFGYAPFVTISTALGIGILGSGLATLTTQPPSGTALSLGTAALISTVIGCYLLSREPRAADQSPALRPTAAAR